MLYDEGHYREERGIVPSPQPPGSTPDPAPSPAYVPPVSAEEKRRASAHVVRPEVRYHYRVSAADLAWKAAELMPDEQEATVRVLAAGGRWLESVGATKEGDKFYVAILRRCGHTELGRKADKDGALPDVPDEHP